MERAVARLDDVSARDSAGALRIVASALASGEHVERLVAGHVRGMPCVVVRTGRRLLVVVDRSGRPLIESLHPLRSVLDVARRPDGSADMSVSDGRRVMVVNGVSDVSEAELLAGSRTVDPAWF